MEEEKKICPNCGKELTKSARKCKYCETKLSPIRSYTIKEQKLADFLGYVFIFAVVAIIVAVLILICKAVASIGINIDWTAIKRIGKFFLIVIGFLICLAGVFSENKIYKFLSWVVIGGTVLNWISEHLEEIGFVLGTVLFLGAGLFLNGGKSSNNGVPRINKERNEIDTKKEEPIIANVVIEGTCAKIYDERGFQIGGCSVNQGSILVSCTGKNFSVRDRNVVKTYDAHGCQISSHSV